MAYPLAEQVHSRINELMVLHEFMADANIKSGSKKAETIMNMWVENKMPYTKQYSHDAPMFRGDPGRAFYRKSDDFPASPDTLGIRKGSVPDWLAEMSHAVQYSNVPQSVRDSLSTASKHQTRMHGDWEYGAEQGNKLFYPSEELLGAWNPYIAEEKPDVPVEFEAHKLIEPLLQERYYGAVNEDLARENPIDDKVIKLLKKYFFKDRN